MSNRHRFGAAVLLMGTAMIDIMGQPVGATSIKAPMYVRASPAFNNAYYVNSATDNPGVTDCASSINTKCGIDNAIAAFNSDTTRDDADEIVFASSIHVFTATAPVQIANGTSGITLTIDGNGQSATAVSGGGTSTDFDIGDIGTGSSSVDISGLTIKDAGAEGSPGYGSGIYNIGTTPISLAVTESTISGNTANADGGGIYTGGPTTLTDDTISGNKSPGGGGGILDRDLQDSDVPVIITDSTISGNSGVGEGGIWNDDGNLTITDSTISGNTANGGNVGGLENDGTATLSDDTISGNKAPAATIAGGGNVGGLENDGTATLSDDTVSGNTASETDGAGIFNINGKTLTVKATIIADNTGGDCYGKVIDDGYNINDDGSCGFSGTNHSISRSTTLDLGALADNGGPTETILPRETSSAVGIIPDPTTLDGIRVCPRTDQRGVSSVGNCTVGAVEEVPAPTITSVNPTSGPLAGANTVTINGTHLSGASRVDFGPKAATHLTIVSASKITVTAPAEGAGSVHVTVTTTGGNSANTTANLYTYDKFQVDTSISPLHATHHLHYSVRLKTLGASVGAIVTWAKVGTLPASLTLSPAGLLSGTPPQAGTFAITVTATEKVASKTTRATGRFSLVVK